jgi:hypothetical protein
MAARLTRDEVTDLVSTILHGVSALEDEGELPRASWPREMREWCVLLLDRLDEGSDE